MCRKSIISLLLVFTVATVFSLNSFAAPQLPTKVADDSLKVALANDPMPQSYPTGMLTGTGTLLVNGNAVQSGATVVSGSIVATDVNSDAVLDLGALGRINLRPSTEIRIVLSANRSEVELRRCGSMTQSVPTGVTTRVTVSTSQMMTVASSSGEVTVRGQVVTGDKGQTSKLEDSAVLQGESKSFDKVEEIIANGEATFTINCGDQDRAGGGGGGGAYVYSPYGFLVLLGLAAGVALGIHIGDNPGSRPGPSQVTPVQT
jgi:hypothetical protein